MQSFKMPKPLPLPFWIDRFHFATWQHRGRLQGLSFPSFRYFLPPLDRRLTSLTQSPSLPLVSSCPNLLTRQAVFSSPPLSAHPPSPQLPFYAQPLPSFSSLSPPFPTLPTRHQLLLRQ